MEISQLGIKLLIGLSSIIGIKSIPEDPSWRLVQGWQYSSAEGYHTLIAESSEVIKECRKNIEGYLKFPMVIQGGYEIFVDDRLVQRSGNTNLKYSTGYYGVPDIKCNDFSTGSILKVKFYSYLEYYSRISFFPYVTNQKPVQNFFSKSIGFGVGSCLTVLGLFSFFIFYGKVSSKLVFGLLFSNLLLGFYFLFSVSEFIPIVVSNEISHKIGLSCLWIGMLLLFKCFEVEDLLSSQQFKFYIFISIIGNLLTLLGPNPDFTQLGTHFMFGPTLLLIVYSFYSLIKTKKINNLTRKDWLQLASMFMFVCCSFNDIFMVIGLIQSAPIFSIGVFGGQYFFALSVNEKIIETYRERDFLRKNLEQEVERKTNELKSTQAELIQSAKLASLGTLAAGIAHEINNSVNYVNGAMTPLERIISQQIKDVEVKNKTDKLLHVMRDGLSLTVGIIKSLRNYTGLNQAKFNDVYLNEVIESVLTILRSKVRNKIETEIQIPEKLKVYGSVVGLNQIFMNLISNAIDAMSEGGKLTVKAEVVGDQVKVCVCDTGPGIPKENMQRIFDPFFTTKGVGQGTGLGLHIVMKEVQSHNAHIDVSSEIGKGTTFTIKFPINELKTSNSEAA